MFHNAVIPGAAEGRSGYEVKL